jgi:hypothetical protein
LNSHTNTFILLITLLKASSLLHNEPPVMGFLLLICFLLATCGCSPWSCRCHSTSHWIRLSATHSEYHPLMSSGGLNHCASQHALQIAAHLIMPLAQVMRPPVAGRHSYASISSATFVWGFCSIKSLKTRAVFARQVASILHCHWALCHHGRLPRGCLE